MTWRHYLRVKTRDPAFLWGMVIAILVGGAAIGLAVDMMVEPWMGPAATVEALEPEPDPQPVEPSRMRQVKQAAQAGEWWAVWKGIPWVIVEGWRRWGLTLLAVLTGVCWLAFLLQAVQPRGWRDIRLWGPLAGLALGVFSIWPTLFFILWQEHHWGLNPAAGLAAGLKYFVLGVGLREELAKFLCVVVLLPWLVRRGDELAALVCSAAVGLGFAMEENVSYIAGSGGAATLARLLTPAPLHMALTGLIGLAAYRACRWPREWGPHFLAVLGVMVLAHGMYDSLIALPALRELAIGAQIIFALLMFQFFRELRPLQALRAEAISLTATFLLGVSLVAAATFVYLSAAVGWRTAADMLAYSIAGEALMVYLFLREMPERLVRT
jgi:RsiW-degrading membrane proteinase PrsW (M82 family)